jgi:hypothetical protein
MKFFRVLFVATTFAVFTIITQIGGIVYLLNLVGYKLIKHQFSNRLIASIFKPISFIAIYLAVTFFIVPPLAKLNGRVPLPTFESNFVQPLNFMTCVLNRNYVRPSLRETVFKVSTEIQKSHPNISPTLSS